MMEFVRLRLSRDYMAEINIDADDANMVWLGIHHGHSLIASVRMTRDEAKNLRVAIGLLLGEHPP